jgi:hypothetical protein
MSGDSIRQYGPGSIGKAQHSGSGDIVAGGKSLDGAGAGASAIDNLLGEIQSLRQHLNDIDRAEVDSAVEEIKSNPSDERFDKLLQRIAGIATIIGDAGTPVVAAIKALLGSP